ncbi:hypothetical protein MLD38_020670 [Melastoma candidum]|uniref:Uncharacterized protein n=1 Tax=Melastoma candidum TaxID=119954 RepID=A0ACB9QEW8_9MYRT|nr:hypothetical protein MLD38_020670 [Melastoma candidum]
MSKQEVMKMQTCVLRVNIHCHGCERKVMKLLRRTEGVYAAKVDAEQGMVTVTGNVDPGLLIWRLEKSGKHAELWSAPKDGSNNNKDSNSQNQNFTNQFQNMMQQNGGSGVKDDGKSQKGGGSGSGGNGKEDPSKLGAFRQNPQQQAVAAAFQAQLQQHMINMKGKNGKDLGVPPGYQKNVKFELLEDKPDMGSDELDKEELDDEVVESHGRAHNDDVTEKGEVVDKKRSSKKDSMFDIQGLMKALGKGGGGGGRDGKKWRKARKDAGSSSYGDNGGKANGGGGKKGGAENGKNNNEGQDGKKKNNKMEKPDQMMMSGRGADDGGGGMGPQMSQVGSYPIASYPPAQRLPGRDHVGDVMKLMNQQQQLQQQQLYGGHSNYGETFHPAAMMTYPRSHPPMPPPQSSDPFVHMFSDENANSCSVM